MLFKTIKICSSLSVAFVSIFGIIPPANAITCTNASFYGMQDGFHGGTTANGERFNTYSNTTAHPYLPFGTRLKVTNSRTGRSVIVRVNDRGPFVSSRGLDLSYGAFSQIASPSTGVARVCYSRV